MKQGEDEAKAILEKIGIRFDSEYQDDNVGHSKADLKCLNGRTIEVTHTKHNNAIYKCQNKYARKSIKEKCETERKVAEALHRLYHLEYDKNGYTEDGKKQFEKDCNLLKKHSGYDLRFPEKTDTEFNVDMPTVCHSVENVIKEIAEDKAKRYHQGDTDLFVFVTEEEYGYFLKLFEELNWNGYAQGCFNRILNSPFQIIYICVWDIFNQKYDVENPVISKLTRIEGNGIKLDKVNLHELKNN